MKKQIIKNNLEFILEVLVQDLKSNNELIYFLIKKIIQGLNNPKPNFSSLAAKKFTNNLGKIIGINILKGNIQKFDENEELIEIINSII